MAEDDNISDYHESVTHDEHEIQSVAGETSYTAFKSLLHHLSEYPGEGGEVSKTEDTKPASESSDENNPDEESRGQAKELYDQKCRAHNQYELFNLMEYITNYEMDEDVFERITFRENVIVNRLELHSLSEQIFCETIPVGGLCIDIQRAEGLQPQSRLLEEYEEKLLRLLDEEGICHHVESKDAMPKPIVEEDSLEEQNKYSYSKFLVHVSSQIDVGGDNGGSSITSWVDRNCHTIEELRKEFITIEDTLNEKSLYTAMKHNWYFVKHTASTSSICEKKLYSMRKARDYISEAANFILMRYLAIKRFFGSFELSCCYINGDLCRNIYECSGPESLELFENKYDCCRIRRTILEECGLKHVCHTILALNGLILKQEWEGCPYVLTCNPNIVVTNDKPTCLDELTLNDCWTNDMQLFSSYLDMKTKSLLENTTYEYDHPELRQLLADYVTQILLLRPPDIREFTFKYFGKFVTTPLPRNDYFE